MQPWLIGFSGGPDSVYLTQYLKEHYPEQSLLLVHINHMLRPEEELAKEHQFIRNFARQEKLPLIIRKAPVALTASKQQESLESAGRYWRYRFFCHLAKHHNCSKIFTAHHLDDDIETFFLKLIRGSQSHLHGMATQRKLTDKQESYTLERPLLHLSKARILKELKQKGQGYSIDSSNQDASFQRNLVRERLVPALKDCDSQWEKHLRISLDHLKAQHDALTAVLAPYLEEIGHKKNLLFCSKRNWRDLNPFLKQQLYFEIIQQWQRQFEPSAYIQSSHINALVNGQSKVNLPCDWIAEQDEYRLRLFPAKTSFLDTNPLK